MASPQVQGLEQGLARLVARQRFGVELGLERMQRLLRTLGDPLGALPVVHLAGTNGKGSTAATIAAALRAAGHRVGLYTSPHLERFNERIEIVGQPIDDHELAALLDEVLSADDEATFFEVVTAVAFLAFGRHELDVAVVETGLGGRLDATNVVRPRLTVLTSIARDHASVLGETLAEIAAEKAGIIKPGVPVVAALPADASVREVLEERAAANAALLLLEGRDFDWEPDEQGRLVFSSPAGRTSGLALALAGRHQLQNAALALAALEQLADLGLPSSFSQRRRALATVRWAGRLERRGRFLLDCAHNPAGVAALVANLSPAEPRVLLFAALADKEAEAMLHGLRPFAERAIFTCVDSPRALPTGQLAALWQGDVRLADNARQALEMLDDGSDTTVLVCGSAYLVGEVRALLSGAMVAPATLADPAASLR